MGTFSASLRTVGDVNSLTATIELSDGRLRIAVGDTEIGDWPLTEIHLEEIPTGYRMAVEGELLLLELNDVSSFSEELAKSAKKRRLRGGGKKKEKKQKSSAGSSGDSGSPPRPAKELVVPSPTPARTPQPTRALVREQNVSPKPSKPGAGSRILHAVDGLLLKAKRKYGAVLPDWVFSRGMFGIVLGMIAVLGVFPEIFSMVLVIIGALGVLFGAVVYNDSVLASRWLPGRATPQQALLAGLVILLLGILVGMIAK